MDLDRFTEKAMASAAAAQETALRMGHQQIEAEHIHLALASQQDGLIPRLLGYMGVDTGAYTQELETELAKIPQVHGDSATPPYASRRLNKILERQRFSCSGS